MNGDNLPPIGSEVKILSITPKNTFSELNEYFVGLHGKIVQHSGYGNVEEYSQSDNSDWDIEIELDQPVTLADENDPDELLFK